MTHADGWSHAAELLDLAGDLRSAEPPPWLRSRLERALNRLGAPPNPRAATAAAARRHDRDGDEALLTAGSEEAFVLLARALQPRRAVCVHPSSTGPEDALRAAGHDVERLVLAPPYVLDPAQVPTDADLVVVGNPSPATGVVHERLAELCRPGRVVVVDEALADAVPGEPHSLATRSDLPGLAVVRSLTATWGLAGLPVGYLLGDPALVQHLRQAQPSVSVSTLGLVALETCLGRGPVKAADAQARLLGQERERLERALLDLGVEVSPGSRAPLLLCRVPGRPDVPDALRAHGIAVRRGDAFPGLTAEHWRTAVRNAGTTEALLEGLRAVL